MSNIVDKLQSEIQRVTEIKEIYLEFPAGHLAASLMAHSITKAISALSNGNPIEIIQAIKDLEEYEL